jgi:hypothetical protein
MLWLSTCMIFVWCVACASVLLQLSVAAAFCSLVCTKQPHAKFPERRPQRQTNSLRPTQEPPQPGTHANDRRPVSPALFFFCTVHLCPKGHGPIMDPQWSSTSWTPSHTCSFCPCHLPWQEILARAHEIDATLPVVVGKIYHRHGPHITCMGMKSRTVMLPRTHNIQ